MTILCNQPKKGTFTLYPNEIDCFTTMIYSIYTEGLQWHKLGKSSWAYTQDGHEKLQGDSGAKAEDQNLE
jgi:hypothetical protein